MSALASPVRKELLAIQETIREPEPQPVIHVNFGYPAGCVPRLGGAFYSGPDAVQACALVGSERPQVFGMEWARMARRSGWVTWQR